MPAKPVSKGGKFGASPIDSEQEEIMAIEVPPVEEQQHYAKLDFTGGQSVETRKLALHNVRTLNPKANGVAVTTDLGTEYFRFNKTSASILTIPPEALSDASLLPASRGLGVGDEEILAPSFINLGHELGHVLRSLQGISANVYGGKKLIEHAFPEVNEEIREEEFFNIDAVENQLRRESGLSRRKGHLDWAANITLRLLNELDQIGEITAALRHGQKLGTLVLSSETLKKLDAIENQCNDLRMPIVQFSKKGGDPRDLQKEAGLLTEKARQLASLPPSEDEEEEAPRKSKQIRRITFDREDRIELVMSGDHLKAAQDIATDGKVEKKWIDALTLALKKKGKFTSRKELMHLVSQSLPDKYERLAEEIVSYLLETEF
jgi:hypothetical protein